MNKLTEHLDHLQKLGLIESGENEVLLEYVFKHVFTQESLYNSLLYSDRRQLHQLVGDILEDSVSANLEDSALMLAHHFELAGDRAKALKYLAIAAKHADETFANEEAYALYQRILKLLDESNHKAQWDTYVELEAILDRLGERDKQASMLTILQTLAELINDNVCLTVTHQRRAVYFDRISEYQESEEAAQISLRLARQAGDSKLTAHSLNLLAQASWRRFQYEDVQAWANQALDALPIVGEPGIRTTALLHLGRASYRLGEYDAALSYIKDALKLTTQTDDRTDEAFCYLILGWIYQRLGDYDTSEQQFQRDLEIRRAIGDRYGEAEALSHLGWVAYDQADYEKGLHYCEDALLLSQNIGDRENEAYALSGMGLAYEGMGQRELAIDCYQQALIRHRAINAQTLVMFDLSRLARLALAINDLPVAYSYTQEVIEWTSQYGAERFWDPWLIHYNNYQVLQANKQTEQAQAILEEAYTLLQTRAKRISDMELRKCFLERVAVNRLISEAWEASQ